MVERLEKALQTLEPVDEVEVEVLIVEVGELDVVDNEIAVEKVEVDILEDEVEVLLLLDVVVLPVMCEVAEDMVVLQISMGLERDV